MKNWKTTVMGLLLIVGALSGAGYQALSGKPVDTAAVAAAIVTGLGLLVAKDFNVSGTAKVLIPLLLIPALALNGCITVRTIDDTGGSTTTTRVDVEAIVVITQLVMTNAPAAWELVQQIQDALDKPDGPSRTDELLALIEQARVLIDAWNANQKAAYGGAIQK